MSDRLTRKEIKRQDTFQTTMVESLDWVRTHRWQLVAGVAILALAVVGLAGWMFWLRATEDDAQALLAEAMAAYRAPVRPDGDPDVPGAGEEPSFPTVEARRARAAELFDRVTEEYGASEAADVARVYLGELAAVDGDTERARELWQEVLDEHPDHMLGAEVRLNLYALDRAEGRGEEVAAELEAMLASDDRPLPEDVVLHELALTLESLGRAEEAAEHYQTLVSQHPQSPYAAAARQKTGGASSPLLGLGS